MAQVTGRSTRLTLPRRWIADLMTASRGMPIISFERRMNLAAVVAARADRGISWTILFAKAFGILCANRRELRQAFVGFPWPHLYESDRVLASVAVEREYEEEPAVFFGLIRDPQLNPLPKLQDALVRFQTQPPQTIKQFRRLIFYSRFPWPLRRALWWYGIVASGKRRARNCGTFGISTTAGSGATALNLISPVATTLNCGPLDAAGTMDVRLHFDHRVLDGMTAARILAELEAILTGVILSELISLPPASP